MNYVPLKNLFNPYNPTNGIYPHKSRQIHYLRRRHLQEHRYFLKIRQVGPIVRNQMNWIPKKNNNFIKK